MAKFSINQPEHLKYLDNLSLRSFIIIIRMKWKVRINEDDAVETAEELIKYGNEIWNIHEVS